MTGAGNIVEIQAHRREDAVQRGRASVVARARPQGHRQAGRPAEDGGDVSGMAQTSPHHRPARDRDPQSGQACRDARPACGLRHRGGIGGRAWTGRAGRNRHHVSRQRPDQGRSRRQGVADAGLCRRFRACGRRAGRRARHLFGALGRAGQGLPVRHEHDSKSAGGTRREDPPNSGAAISFRRCASPGPTATSRNSRRRSTARSCGRRAERWASATIRCSCRTATTARSVRCRPRRSTACRRAAKAFRTAPGLSQAGGRVPRKGGYPSQGTRTSRG